LPSFNSASRELIFSVKVAFWASSLAMIALD
jgi:hypothetical protein